MIDTSTFRNVLVITSKTFTSGFQIQFEKYSKLAGLPAMAMRYERSLTMRYSIPADRKKWKANPAMQGMFFKELRDCIIRNRPRIILINDAIAAQYIAGKELPLGLLRGGVYFVDGIPAIMIDDLRTQGGMPKLKAVNHFAFLLLKDMQKAKRWYDGTQRREPQFNLHVLDSPESLVAFESAARNATLIGMDLETFGAGKSAFISVSGYACLQPDGTVLTFVLPLIEPYGATERIEGYRAIPWIADAYASMQRVHDMQADKVLQNGGYDANYYIKYRVPPRNWTLDTCVLFHSLWPEIPKRIDFIASIAVDHYRYWKDEGKEGDKDDDNETKLPRTFGDWQKYLRYNGLDCHYLIPVVAWELAVLSQAPWAKNNYRISMRQVVGPAAAMSMRGVPVDKEIQVGLTLTNQAASDAALADLRVMTDWPEYNPGSPDQNAKLIYDILRAEPLKKRGAKKGEVNRSTNENDLEIIRTQHPLLDIVINKIWDYKKPLNNVAKYGDGRFYLLNGRWMYKLNPIGTETGRYSSKKHDFWIGQQIQNPPYEVRPMVCADPGYVRWRADLSKADFWHTAFASLEPRMLEIVQREDIDLHCWHAAQFFKKPYEEIYAAYKRKEAWVVHSTEGCRQNTKRISYGANYLMQGYTLYVTIMGKEAMDATAYQMGRDTRGWTLRDYAKFGDELIDYYYSVMYPGLIPWLERRAHYVATHGQIETCSGGRTRFFFGDVASDAAAQRELAAFYGQGGTAGTVNTALDDIYYSGVDRPELFVEYQLHDELGGQVRINCIDQLAEIKRRMEITNIYNGREFTIPVEMEVGHGWGYRMTEWHPGITIDEIDEADKKWRKKNPELFKSLSEQVLSL